MVGGADMDDGLITPYIHGMDECALQIPTTMMSGLVKKSLSLSGKLASLQAWQGPAPPTQAVP